MSRLTLLLCQLLVAVVVLGLWQLFATVPIFGRVLLPPFFFSNPLDVGSQIFDWFASGVIWKHLLITLWESEAAIEAFAGVPIDRARYYPEDDDFLLEREPTVTHYFVSGGSTLPI